jgi:hypothetical protein
MRRIKIIPASILAAMLVVGYAGPGMTAEQVGAFASVTGDVVVEAGQRAPRPAQVAGAVNLDDSIRTGSDGAASVLFDDDSVLRVDADSLIRVDAAVYDSANSADRKSQLSLLRGRVRAFVSRYSGEGLGQFAIQTGNGIAGVRGTEFVVTYDPATDITEILTLEGVVEASNSRLPSVAAISLRANELTTIEGNRPPTPPRRLDDNDRQLYLRGLRLYGAGQAPSKGGKMRSGEPFAVPQVANQPPPPSKDSAPPLKTNPTPPPPLGPKMAPQAPSAPPPITVGDLTRVPLNKRILAGEPQ